MIVVFFLFVTLLIAYLLFKAEGSNALKVVILLVLFYASSAVWFSFDSYKGWPTEASPRDDAIILSVAIFDKTNTSPGSIYVTAIPCTGDVSECETYAEDDGLMTKLSPYRVFGYAPKARNTPRIYEFPYTEENRKAFSEARENVSNGGRSTIKGAGKKGQGKGGQHGKEETEGGMMGGDGQENAGIDDAPQIINEGPQDLLRKD